MPDFAVRMIPIANLRDHPRNSNRHGDHQLAVLEQRFSALGWYKNVVVAEWEGTTTLLAGHGVTRGAERAGETVAPCHVREIDPLSAEALDILEGDNTVADLAEPDLHERLRNLVELDAAGRLGNVGFDDGALDRLKAELQAEDFAASQGPPVEDPGPSEPPAEPVSKLGDVWLCGQHRVVCGDCTEVASLHAALNGEHVRLCFTSPPYNLGTTTGGGFPANGGMWRSSGLEHGYGVHDDAMPQEDYFRWQALLMQFVWDEALADDGALYYNHRPRVQDGILLTALTWNPGLPIRQIVIWNSGSGVNFASTHYRPAHEWIVIFAKPDFRLGSKSASGCGDVWSVPSAVRADGHPAPFPVDLPARAIETTGARSVYDPFLGSGTTLIAAEQLGRVCYGIEIEPRYVDVAVRRWQQATHQPAILESTGEPFPVVE